MSAILTYPQPQRHKTVVSCLQHLPHHLSFLQLGEYSSNPFLLSQRSYFIALFAGRLVLLHNDMLYPGSKQFLAQLEKAPEKPKDFLKLIQALLKEPTIANGEAVIDSVLQFTSWPQPTEEEKTWFTLELEQLSPFQ